MSAAESLYRSANVMIQDSRFAGGCSPSMKAASQLLSSVTSESVQMGFGFASSPAILAGAADVRLESWLSFPHLTLLLREPSPFFGEAWRESACRCFSSR